MSEKSDKTAVIAGASGANVRLARGAKRMERTQTHASIQINFEGRMMPFQLDHKQWKWHLSQKPEDAVFPLIFGGRWQALRTLLSRNI